MKHYYKQRIPIILASISLLVLLTSSSDTTTREKESLIMGSIQNLSSTFHYSPVPINDEFSIKAYELYLQSLDWDKMYLTKNDIAILETYKTSIDDELIAKSTNFFDLSLEIINKKIAQVKPYYKEILEKPFDFTVNDSFQIDNKKRVYAINEVQLREN
ncbi:MAG: hypothetical protein SNJ71_03985 [Bacteroidales bacterium]